MKIRKEENNNDEEIMDFNTVAGISHTILTNNGDLWRIYPEAKKIAVM